jgi:hypothetical protein
VIDFVAALWIFRKCSGIGVGTTISWGDIDVEIEPSGAESRLILPRYVPKNGIAVECDVPIMWNQMHSHMLTSKTKTSLLPSASPFNYHFLHRYINLPQIDDTKASVRTVCTQTDTRSHPSGYWVHNWPKLCGISSFGGWNLSFWNVKFTSMTKDRDNIRPIIVAAHHHRSDMIWDGAMTKSYSVLLQILAIFWVPEYFVEVGAGIWANDYSDYQ